MDEERIKIYSYAKVWHHEKKIYNIMNVVMPTPVSPYDAAGFIGIIFLEMVLGTIFPIFAKMPFIIKYFIVPYLTTYVLRKKKLDGKNPISYFLGVIRYYITVSGTYVEGWKRIRDKSETVKLAWYYSRGRKGEKR